MVAMVIIMLISNHVPRIRYSVLRYSIIIIIIINGVYDKDRVLRLGRWGWVRGYDRVVSTTVTATAVVAHMCRRRRRRRRHRRFSRPLSGEPCV